VGGAVGLVADFPRIAVYPPVAGNVRISHRKRHGPTAAPTPQPPYPAAVDVHHHTRNNPLGSYSYPSNRYTVPAGARSAAAARGTAAASTAANVAVLAAIMSSSVCTGVASSCTPLA
jgi:hypothetical protein